MVTTRLHGVKTVANSRAMKFFGYWVILAYVATRYLLPNLYQAPKEAGEHGGMLYMVRS